MRMSPLLIVSLAIAACSDGSGTTDPGSDVTTLRAVPVADGLTSPLHLDSPPGDARLFVVEQEGRIRVIADGELLPEPFLDLSSAVFFEAEAGLLGLTFDPDYAGTGHFWITYTPADDRAVVLARYRVSDDPNVADPSSALEVLRIPKPTWSHNGGQLEFGADGMLYVSVGDGGEYQDPEGHGQNPHTLLGTILRIDVRSAEPYAIPAGNPFDGENGRPEVWAYGLRNPWRFALDTIGGVLYIADVGQHHWEEVNAVPLDTAPVNFGWSVMEGSGCHIDDTCDTTGMTGPVLEYERDEGCSVIGGYAYRGQRLTGLQGEYFFGDYCLGWVHSMRLENGAVTDRTDWNLGYIGHILGFGQDAAGELYVLTTGGTVYRLDPG